MSGLELLFVLQQEMKVSKLENQLLRITGGMAIIREIIVILLLSSVLTT